ncbi:MAG: H-X9-DG-CTERM domain-containing protein [Armatimonadota bacterium]
MAELKPLMATPFEDENGEWHAVTAVITHQILPSLVQKGSRLFLAPFKPMSSDLQFLPLADGFKPITTAYNDGRKKGVRSAAFECPWWISPGLSLAEVEDTSNTLMLMDTGDGRTDDGRTTYAQMDLWSENYTDYGPYPYVAVKHQGGFNATFVDGHAKWQKHSSTKANMWSIQSD